MPYYFVSYSSREQHVGNLLDNLQLVLRKHFEQRRTPTIPERGTPTIIESGESQYEQIVRDIEGASFGVVILDGLRPNVVFEYGIMVGKGIPVLLFKEETAEVDVTGYYTEVPPTQPGRDELLLPQRPKLLVDSHFSDVKDRGWTTWFKFDPQKTRRVILEEYKKKRDRIKDFLEIEETGPLFQ